MYSIFRELLAPFFECQVIGKGRLSPGPAVYIANHLGAVGPLAIVCSLPMRMHPWAIAEMMDHKRAPQYLYDDFVHPTLGLSGRVGMALSILITKISVPLLHSIGCIPVERYEGVPLAAYKRSLDILKARGNILIFPEDNQKPIDPETHMAPFMRGFAVLSLMYEQQTKKALPIYPLVANPETRTLLMGEKFNTKDYHNRQEIESFTQQAADEMKLMFLSLSAV